MEKSRAEILGENLERILKEKGIARKDFAEKLGVTVNAVGTYINAQREPSLNKIFEMAEILKVSVLDLLGNNGYAPTKIDAEKQIFEYRFQRAFSLATAAGLDPCEFDGFFNITFFREVKLKNDDGTFENSHIVSMLKIPSKKDFVKTIEDLALTAAISEMSILELLDLKYSKVKTA